MAPKKLVYKQWQSSKERAGQKTKNIYTQSEIRVIEKNAMAQKMLMMAVLVILGTKIATVTAADPTCLQRLMSCTPYLNNATLQLQGDCCDPLRQAVATELTCLCSLINNSTLLRSFNIPIAAALRITRGCGVTDQMNGCIPAIPTPAPSPSATSPTSAPLITRR
ncbi:non-specific lipid transfer protein GPI-anchored 7 isoform X2 [Gossypium hirsutum]|uniref:Non-specific lipid transfer protein GPI-anchored 7 isoform X2 n=1 Tax=Gossypium hirsutum TaxID=3635 RepID=A0A1U8PWL1_GOSHI|nr:non-specific lipid transfer protein GPI-anchored 7-like isoform X2 [Gossypium hirsutum]